MVELKNIKRDKDYISCVFYPEDSEKGGKLVVDPEKETIIECEYPLGYEWCSHHVGHAERFLYSLKDKTEFPDEKLIMWV